MEVNGVNLLFLKFSRFSRIHSLKYIRSYDMYIDIDIGIRKSEFVAKTLSV